MDRYDLKYCDTESGGCTASMKIRTEGDWVRAEDALRCERERDELREACETVLEASGLDECYLPWIALKQLRAAIAAAKGES